MKNLKQLNIEHTNIVQLDFLSEMGLLLDLNIAENPMLENLADNAFINLKQLKQLNGLNTMAIRPQQLTYLNSLEVLFLSPEQWAQGLCQYPSLAKLGGTECSNFP